MVAPSQSRRLGVRLVCFALWCGYASACCAGLFDDEEARRAILDLRQKFEVMEQARLHDKEAAQAFQEMPKTIQLLRDENNQIKRSLLETQTLIEQMRADFAKQLGQQEQLTRDVAELQRRQRDLAQGVDDRMRRLEPVKINLEGREFLADPAEVKEFEFALGLLRKSDFKASAQAFIDFLRRYPQSGYQSVGLFWLGNAQYANRDYREAIVNFKSSVQAHAASSKSPEALLAVANSQQELKDNRAARRTLEDLIRLYPQSEAAAAGKDRLAKLK